MPDLYTSDDPADLERFGSKAASLAALGRRRLPIPEWFVICPAAFDRHLPESTRKALEKNPGATEVEALLADILPDRELMQAVHAAYVRIAPNGERVAVRSSAIDEDGEQYSFAGQLESYLQVKPEMLAEHIARVWQSAFAPQVIEYRRKHQLDILPQAPAVLVQRMVDAQNAGVAFAADPVSGHRCTTLINAVAGTADKLVAGEVNADSYRIHHQSLEIEYPEDPLAPRLEKQQLLELQQLTMTCSKHFGRPQDIEWAFDGEQVWLLQSRAITTLDQIADPDGRQCLWDNSNIVESYGGICSPLTYSFARGAYEAVYSEFARLLGMSARRLQQHRQIYANMLGYIQGRVYYNLLNWYRALAMLPGFSINRRFMEQMMGVTEGLPDDIVAELDGASLRTKIKDSFQLLRSTLGLWWNYVRLPAKTRRFYRRLDDALVDAGQLRHLRLDQLAAHYRELEQRLLLHWDAPLINDLFAMIFHGLLRALCQKWFDQPLDNDLLCAQGGVVSAEPARRIEQMATLAAQEPSLQQKLQKLSEADWDADDSGRFAKWPEFASEFDSYLVKFGDRCLEELKLESSSTRDDPRMLLATIAGLAGRDFQHPVLRGEETEQPAAAAEQLVRQKLRRHPLRRRLFGWVLKTARRLVRERENLRFERTRVFGRVRSIVMEMGKRLVAANRIEQASDVFYLEINELLGLVEGTTTTSRLADLIALRKLNEADYRNAPEPDERFHTHGAAQVCNTYHATVDAPVEVSGDSLQGIGTCPGVAEGIVRCINDPQQARLEPGEILVAPRTDPGWVMLFAGAAGVLVERGSLLSHSAIVTRELGIPSIVAVPGLMGWLKDGDRVRFDGSNGVIERLDAQAETPTRKTA